MIFLHSGIRISEPILDPWLDAIGCITSPIPFLSNQTKKGSKFQDLGSPSRTQFLDLFYQYDLKQCGREWLSLFITFLFTIDFKVSGGPLHVIHLHPRWPYRIALQWRFVDAATTPFNTKCLFANQSEPDTDRSRPTKKELGEIALPDNILITMRWQDDCHFKGFRLGIKGNTVYGQVMESRPSWYPDAALKEQDSWRPAIECGMWVLSACSELFTLLSYYRHNQDTKTARRGIHIAQTAIDSCSGIKNNRPSSKG